MSSYEQGEGLTRFLDQVAGHRLLKAHEEQELAERFRAGDEAARHELVMHNMRLVVSIARNFINRGLPLDDLIQAGSLGLDRASRKFNPTLGFKFSTYASWWIRQSIQRAVSSEGKTIRVPNQVSTRRLRVESYLRDNPGASTEDVARGLDCTPAQVLRAQRVAEVSSSLDADFFELSQTSLVDTIADPYAEDPHEVFASGAAQVLEALGELENVTQREVLVLCFGINGEKEHSLQEIAVLLELPLKAVQAAKKEGLARLREIMLD